MFRWGGISPVENDFEWQSQRKKHLKNGFSLCRRFIYLTKNLFGPKISRPLFLLLIGNYSVFLRSFPFYFFPIFDRESFFSFLPFLSFHFSLSISFFGNSGLSIRYLLSLEEILRSSSSGERMRILFMGQGSR